MLDLIYILYGTKVCKVLFEITVRKSKVRTWKRNLGKLGSSTLGVGKINCNEGPRKSPNVFAINFYILTTKALIVNISVYRLFYSTSHRILQSAV